MFTEKSFHLVGIGGIGVSGLARILWASGKQVSGSDGEVSPIIEKLVAEGFDVKIGQKAENLPAGVEVVIHTTAARADNPELVEAKKRGLKILTYPEALGVITKNKKLVAVAGAHGKTTTTSLIIAGALSAGEDISCLVGTNLKELGGGNARVGQSSWFILEACEYKRAFLNLTPEILIITNIEAEHLDYYKDLEDYKSAFVELAGKSQKVVANSGEANMQEVTSVANKFIDAKSSEGEIGQFRLLLSGEHNRKNAALAYTALAEMGLDLAKAKVGIESYTGGWRRFEVRGEWRGATIIDDYAHHPTEIKATLSAAREKYPNRRIVIVYQQHQLDRAAKMLGELGVSFADADVVVIPNIYKVRDEAEATQKISGENITEEIRKYQSNVHYTQNFENTIAWLKENIKKDDVLIIAGAGDIFKLTDELVS